MAILTREFKSSSSDKVYTAQLDTDTGQTSCDCPGWRFVRPGKERGCKHTAQMQKLPAGAAARVAAKRAARVDAASNGKESGAEGPAVKPMLASAMPDGRGIESFAGGDWIAEEKFDGHRLLVRVTAERVVTAWSRPGATHGAIERPLPPKIAAAMAELPRGLYDGELYLPGGTSSDVTRLDKSAQLALVLFDLADCMGQSILDKSYKDRRALLEVAVAHTKAGGPVHIAEALPCTLATVKAIWKRGGEGVILKRLGATYKSGYRSPDWVKVKPQGSAVFTITGYEEGKSGPYSVVLLRHADGRETSCKVLNNDTLRAIEAAPKKFLGKRLVVSHNGFTSSGLWRHAMWDHLAGEGE